MSRDDQEPLASLSSKSKTDGSKSKYKRILLKLSGEALMGIMTLVLTRRCWIVWRWKLAS